MDTQLLRSLGTAGVLICLASSSRANPAGGRVAGGAASLASSGSTVTVNQTTNRAIIDWQSFSIGAGETTNFNLPSAGGAVLNRVTGGNPSAIYGTLQSNGAVYLLNPNGILVGAGGRIRTQGFIASTLDTDSTRFMQGGDLTFQGASRAIIQNFGRIEAAGGDIILIGRQITNAGALEAAGGAVGLAAGNAVLLSAAGDRRIHVLSGLGASADTGVNQQGAINAAQAELSAAGGNVYGLAVNVGGLVSVQGVKQRGGRIYLTSDQGLINVSGAVSARNPGGGDQGNDASIANASAVTIAPSAVVTAGATGDNGGKLVVWSDGVTDFAGTAATGAKGRAEISGHTLAFTGTVDTRGGHLLIDPTDITIDFSNVNALLVTPLSTGDLTISATNDITYNSPLLVNLGGTGHKLTIAAGNDFIINQGNLTASGDIDYTIQAGRNVQISNFQTLFINNDNHGDLKILAGQNLGIDNSLLPSGGIQFTSVGSSITLVADNAHAVRPAHASAPLSIANGTYIADNIRLFATAAGNVQITAVALFRNTNLVLTDLNPTYDKWYGDSGTSATGIYIKATDSTGTTFKGAPPAPPTPTPPPPPPPTGSGNSSALSDGQQLGTVTQNSTTTCTTCTTAAMPPTPAEQHLLQLLECYSDQPTPNADGYIRMPDWLNSIGLHLGYPPAANYWNFAENVSLMFDYATGFGLGPSNPGYLPTLINLASGSQYSESGILGESIRSYMMKQGEDDYDDRDTQQTMVAALTAYSVIQDLRNPQSTLNRNASALNTLIAVDNPGQSVKTLIGIAEGRDIILKAIRTLVAQGKISL